MTRVLTIAAALSIASCSSISVTQDFDPSTDFSTLRTYSWYGNVQGVDQLTAQRIVRAVDNELNARGYRKLDSGTPDFQVNALASVQQKIDVRPTTVSVGYGWGRGYMGMSTGNQVSTYDEGTLVLDLVAPSTKSLLWRGTAKAAVDPNRTPEEREARVREAVHKILEQFPPKRQA